MDEPEILRLEQQVQNLETAIKHLVQGLEQVGGTLMNCTDPQAAQAGRQLDSAARSAQSTLGQFAKLRRT